MNESEFYKATQSRALKGPYLLHGEEELTKADAVARVKKLLDPGVLDLNCQSLRNPDVDGFLSAADQLPFFDEMRLLLVEAWEDGLIDALEKGWAWGWRKKGWIKSDKKPALNPDLWEMLLNLTSQHEMHYHWVKGHADNEYNNRCDAMAVAEREKFQ